MKRAISLDVFAFWAVACHFIKITLKSAPPRTIDSRRAEYTPSLSEHSAQTLTVHNDQNWAK